MREKKGHPLPLGDVYKRQVTVRSHRLGLRRWHALQARLLLCLSLIHILLICLGTKVVKLSQVKIAADFLIDIMPPMFIPAAVGLIVVCGDLKEILIPVVVITCLSTVIVLSLIHI